MAENGKVLLADEDFENSGCMNAWRKEVIVVMQLVLTVGLMASTMLVCFAIQIVDIERYMWIP
jgi:hypothetical protein